ncbi:homing endonuclease associated repeat-containing protein [Halomontanus rarus]|uniref:homing endonuclease associated repeat-containing protein n=1 Tax=Halomontanus rarus TaxID=3034020 RepID=UPI00293BB1FF|nr:HNH endonuclease [Halovivax sp. KZCA124]
MGKNRITREELIEEVKCVGNKLGKSPTKNEFGDHGKYSLGPYNRRFNGWNTVLEKAGFGPNHRSNVSKDALLAEIERLHNETGETPTTSILRNQGRYSMYSFYKYFDSWNDAIKQCDFEPRTGGIEYTDQELIEELLRLKDELSRTPSAKHMTKLGKFSAQPYKDHFGSWNNALMEAGLDPNCLIDIPREELLIELHRIHNQLDRSPTKEEFAEMACYSAEPYKRTFGSWNDALRDTGLPMNKRDKIPKEDLIDELTRVAEKLGETPTREQMKRFSRFYPTIYSKRFESWNEAVQEAGLEPVIQLNIGYDELLKHLENLIDDLGHVPTKEELHKYGDYSEQPYRSTFGSWNDAIRELGYQPRHLWGESEEDYRYYGANWPHQRDKRIEVDQYECRNCGCSQNEHYNKYEQDLHVHHINKFNKFDSHQKANRLENLITLCRNCHSKLEGKPKSQIISLWPEVYSVENENYTLDAF